MKRIHVAKTRGCYLFKQTVTSMTWSSPQLFPCPARGFLGAAKDMEAGVQHLPCVQAPREAFLFHNRDLLVFLPICFVMREQF